LVLDSWQDEDSSNDAAKDELSGPMNESVNLRMVIQALRTRVRELEKEINSGIHNDGNHCLVCMVSVVFQLYTYFQSHTKWI